MKTALFFVLASICWGQSDSATQFYRFDFAVKEMDGGRGEREELLGYRGAYPTDYDSGGR